jgi:bacteriorhodopsin
MTIIQKTAYFSLFVQFVTGLIDLYGLTINVSSNYLIFKDLLLLELIVQIIEFIFYVWMTKNIDKKKNITVYRYFDWFITTPTMLLTLMAYLDTINNPNPSTNLVDFIKKYYKIILVVLVLNWTMLGFGLMGELGWMDTKKSATIGFIPFVLYFWIIYYYFVEKNINITKSEQKSVYFYFLIIWSLYGVSALMNYQIKNSMYNILDLFAKNFFGLFLVYILYKNKQ